MPKAIASTFDRDSYARWYAQRHMDIDEGILRIFYLPNAAPPREIRLLEINRLISEITPPEPIDFAVDIDGADAHTLYVLDVTPKQWEAIEQGAMQLPPGWSLAGRQELSQRGRL